MRAIDNTICPKDETGQLTGAFLSKNACHMIHKTVHEVSPKIGIARGGSGGSGEYDAKRIEHYSKQITGYSANNNKKIEKK